jgi:hypothetical protein
MTGLSQPAVCCGPRAGDLYAGGTQQSTGQTFSFKFFKNNLMYDPQSKELPN